MHISKVEPLIWEFFNGSFMCMACGKEESDRKVQIKKGDECVFNFLTCNSCSNLDAQSLFEGLGVKVGGCHAI